MNRLTDNALLLLLVATAGVAIFAAASRPPAFGKARAPGGGIELVQAGAGPSSGTDSLSMNLLIRNSGRAADTLLQLFSCKASRTLVRMNGRTVWAMDAAHGAAVGVLPPRGELDLRPGHGELHLEGLVGPQVGGDSVPLSLVFARAGTVTRWVPVRPTMVAGAGR